MIETLQMYFSFPFVRYALIVGVLRHCFEYEIDDMNRLLRLPRGDKSANVIGFHCFSPWI